jgi:hypothetical protein
MVFFVQSISPHNNKNIIVVVIVGIHGYSSAVGKFSILGYPFIHAG